MKNFLKARNFSKDYLKKHIKDNDFAKNDLSTKYRIFNSSKLTTIVTKNFKQFVFCFYGNSSLKNSTKKICLNFNTKVLFHMGLGWFDLRPYYMILVISTLTCQRIFFIITFSLFRRQGCSHCMPLARFMHARIIKSPSLLETASYYLKCLRTLLALHRDQIAHL